MNLTPLSPLELMLVKWTALLALGWIAHAMLCSRHARWRLILWRGILCLSLAMPLMQLSRVSVFTIPISEFSNPISEADDWIAPHKASDVSQALKPAAQPTERPKEILPVQSSSSVIPPASGVATSWRNILLVVWILGCVGGAIRLSWFSIQLSRLAKNARPASAALHQLARGIMQQHRLSRSIQIRISDAAVSPFVLGLWQPAILVPAKLANNLSREQSAALLGHELAHVRQNDIAWSLGWRWMKAIFWFHPLIWRIPAAHSLACEQEADRIASSNLENGEAYPQLLSQLALLVLARPAVETQMAMNGTSQIAKRLHHLRRKQSGVWKRGHTVAGLALVGMLFLLTAGCDFSKSPERVLDNPENIEFRKIAVLVQDEAGNPIEGVSVKPFGLRVQGPRRVDGRGWNTRLYGPEEAATTDHDGKAWVKYPVVADPEEKLLTGELTLIATHPDFCPLVSQDYSIIDKEESLRMIRGILLEISGYCGHDRQPVLDLVPTLGQEGMRQEYWNISTNGICTFRQLSAGGHLIQLMGRLPSGEVVYSEGFDFVAEKEKAYRFALEMKPGIRLEGCLDNNVPRPVKNGRALIEVRPKQIPAYLIPEDGSNLRKKYGANRRFWCSYRPIAEDGTFTFESVPPGEVDVIVHGDGFVSKSVGQVKNRLSDGTLSDGPVIGIPQPFPLQAPATRIMVTTEPTATLEVIAKSKWGKPIPGATVFVNPNVIRMGGIFGMPGKSSEESFREIMPLPNLRYSATTDQNGRAILRNIPSIARGLDIEHFQYAGVLNDPHGLPDRWIRLELKPGITNQVSVTMQPKGKDFIGTAK